MKKLLLIVTMVAGALVLKAQDVPNKKQKSTQNERNNVRDEDLEDNQTQDDADQDEQQGAAENVPDKAKQTLKSKYPAATKVAWDQEGDNYEAEFTEGESEYTVLFDDSGKWLSTRVDNMALNEVPRPVKDGIKRSEFKAWDIEEVDFMDSPTKSTYKVEVKNGIKEKELTVDKNGNILKKGDKSSM